MRRALLILAGLSSALLAYNALFVVHYDVDLVGVMAATLGITIPTLGYGLATLAVVFFALAMRRRP